MMGSLPERLHSRPLSGLGGVKSRLGPRRVIAGTLLPNVLRFSRPIHCAGEIVGVVRQIGGRRQGHPLRLVGLAPTQRLRTDSTAASTMIEPAR